MNNHKHKKRALNGASLPSPSTHHFSSDDKESSLGDEKHQLIAEHYSARSNQTVEEREASPIIHLKKLNNWIKSILIRSYARRGDSVLDVACGKGGDLIKWDKAKIGYYVGIDVAHGSIEDARNRYNGETDHMKRRNIFSFPARLVCADCYSVPLDKILKDDGPFDICSCQFALHYSWSTQERARRALQNVAALLKPGGYFLGTIPDANVIVKKLRDTESLTFGNGVYNVKFDDSHYEKKFPSSKPFGIQYEFHLEDAVDCPEWLVPFPEFKSLAEEYNLELVSKQNFHEFVHEHILNQDYAELMRKLGALGDGTSRDTISLDEWDAAYLYMTFVFRKAGQSQPRNQNSKRKAAAPISQEDILYLE